MDNLLAQLSSHILDCYSPITPNKPSARWIVVDVTASGGRAEHWKSWQSRCDADTLRSQPLIVLLSTVRSPWVFLKPVSASKGLLLHKNKSNYSSLLYTDLLCSCHFLTKSIIEHGNNNRGTSLICQEGFSAAIYKIWHFSKVSLHNNKKVIIYFITICGI